MGKALKKLRGYDLVKRDGTRGLVKLTTSNISTYKFKDTLSYENAPSGYLNVHYIVPEGEAFRYNDTMGVNVIDGFLRYRGDSNYQPDNVDYVVLRNYSPYLGIRGWDSQYEGCKTIQIPDDAVVTTESGVDVTTEFFAWLSIDADKLSEESVVGTWQVKEEFSSDILTGKFSINGNFYVIDRDAWEFVIVPLARFEWNNPRLTLLSDIDLTYDTYNSYYLNFNDEQSIFTQHGGSGYSAIPKTNVNAPTLRTFQITGGDDINKEAFVNMLKAVATRIS